MKSVNLEQNIVFVAGNPAGFIYKECAVVDRIFQTVELELFLKNQKKEVEWKDGIFEKLIMNRRYYEAEQMNPPKKIRIWQLKQEIAYEMHFTSCDEMINKYGEVDLQNYNMVFEGAIDTNDLEEVYRICNTNPPQGYHGQHLSISDVLEQYDAKCSEYHMVDRFGFKEIKLNSI